MTLAELKTILSSTGYSVAYQAFDESNVPDMPFICYAETTSNNFAADNQVYKPIKQIEVQLFSKNKNTTAEATVESTLDNNHLVWEKSCEFNESEICYRTIYTIQII